MRDQSVPAINKARCSGCGRCVAACREHLITLETSGHRKYAHIVEPDRCTHCGACITACQLQAITTNPFCP